MTDGWAPREFQVVRRGYSAEQVDETFSHLVRDLTVLRAERDALRRACAELEARVHQLGTEANDAPTYRGLGERVERILALAEEEAIEVRQTTHNDVRRERDLAEREAASVRADASAHAEETRVRIETDVRHLLEAARREADEIREDAERFARTRRDEADNVFEQNRAKAAEAATDFEIMLAQRREQAERDFATRLASAQSELEAAERRAETLEGEAAQVRSEADRRAAQTLDAATVLAEERVREATNRAERARQDSERELIAMMQRRDSINMQLTNVRQMLATLTGSAAALNPLGDAAPGDAVTTTESQDPAQPGAAAAPAGPGGRGPAAVDTGRPASRRTTAVGRVAASLAARTGGSASAPAAPTSSPRDTPPSAASAQASAPPAGTSQSPLREPEPATAAELVEPSHNA